MKLKYLILALVLVSSNVYAGCKTRTSAVVDGDEVTSSRNVTVCEDGATPDIIQKVKIGDAVFENEMDTVPEIKPTYFKYKYSKCRLFRERYMWNGKLRLNHGTICQIQPNDALWTVVDKW